MGLACSFIIFFIIIIIISLIIINNYYFFLILVLLLFIIILLFHYLFRITIIIIMLIMLSCAFPWEHFVRAPPVVHLRLRLRRSRCLSTTAKNTREIFRSRCCNVLSRTAKVPTQAPHGATVLFWKGQEGRPWGGRSCSWHWHRRCNGVRCRSEQ